MDQRISVIVAQLQRQELPPRIFQAATINHAKPVKLTLPQLAALVNLSPSWLRVLFKAETQQTIPQYAKHLKMERARELLLTTHWRVAEIAAHLDYEDPSHFVREFKRMYGVTPCAYRHANTRGHEQSPEAMNSHPVH